MGRVKRALTRAAIGAGSGALLLLAYGQLTRMAGMTCNTLCKPEVGAPMGAVFGAVAFLLVFDDA